MLTCAYNAAGELLSEAQRITLPQAQPERKVGYRYDADGNRSAVTYPDGSQTVLAYTARGQLASVGTGGAQPLAAYAYNAAGSVIQKTLENGASSAYNYDTAQRLVNITHSLAGNALNLAYTINSTGSRTERAESFGGASRKEAHGYDAVDQLVEVR